MFELPVTDPGAPDLRSAARFMLWVARQQQRVLVTGAVFGVLWMTSQAVIPLALGAALGATVRRDRGQIVTWSAVLLALGITQAVAGILRHRRAVANFLQSASRVEQLMRATSVVIWHDRWPAGKWRTSAPAMWSGSATRSTSPLARPAGSPRS
jgi:hypothetical protein